jgi:hypothetical protein
MSSSTTVILSEAKDLAARSSSESSWSAQCHSWACEGSAARELPFGSLRADPSLRSG